MDDSKTEKGVAAEAPAELAAVVVGIEPRVDNNKPISTFATIFQAKMVDVC